MYKAVIKVVQNTMVKKIKNYVIHHPLISGRSCTYPKAHYDKLKKCTIAVGKNSILFVLRVHWYIMIDSHPVYPAFWISRHL